MKPINKETRTTIIFVIFQVILIIAAFALGVVITRINGYAQSDLPLLNEAYSILQTYGLKEPPIDPSLEYGMIHGMVQAYGDPYTLFIEPVQNELQTDQLTGKFGGIGSKILQDPDGFFYLIPYPDSPAQAAGIGENDRLLFVEGVTITPDMTTDQIASLIRGPEGTRVKVTVSQAPVYLNEVDFSIKRVEVALPSIEYFMVANNPNIGLIQINIIAESTPDELTAAVEDLQSKGADRFIIDLRNNGGGLLNAGEDLAKLFLHNDEIVIQKQSKNEDVETVSTTKDGLFSTLDILLLINENTASAAEIFAGALQANHRSFLVGKQSYGKNTIQLIFNLQDDSSIHVTSAEWWFPALESFTHGNGLIPDINFPDIDGMDPSILDAAIHSLLN